MESGYVMAQQLLNLPGGAPTAIITCNNFIAVGLSRLLREQGLRVPQISRWSHLMICLFGGATGQF